MNIGWYLMNCDECGCRDTTFDERMGERTCDSCGLIIVLEAFEETIAYINDGEVTRSPDKGKLGSIISGKGSYKFNKFGKNSVMPTHIQKGLRLCFMVTASIAPNSNLKDRVEELYVELQRHNVFGNSPLEERASAVVAYALRENLTPISTKEICEEFNVKSKVVNRILRKIIQYYRNSIHYHGDNPPFLLSRELSKITKDIYFKSRCLKVLEFFEPIVQDNTFTKGRSYYVAICWITANIYLHKEITATMLTDKSGFSRFSIRKQTNAIIALVGYTKVDQLQGKQFSELGD